MEHLIENQPIERNNNNNVNNINQLGEIHNNQNQNMENNNIEQNNNIDNNIDNNINNNINENNNINNNNNIPPNNPQNNEEAQGGVFNFANFNLNNLNYNRFRHVLRSHELEFLLNQKYSKSLWEIICTITFTKKCHKISFFILSILFFCISYLLVIKNYKNSSIILKLESEDSYFEAPISIPRG